MEALTCENRVYGKNYSVVIEPLSRFKKVNFCMHERLGRIVKAWAFCIAANFSAYTGRGILFRLRNGMFLLDEKSPR